MTSAEYLEWITDHSYLELGVDNCVNFNNVKSKDKLSVDINGKAEFNGTTDRFFEVIKRHWDIIFIDANHTIEYVLRDFNNSLKVVNDWIIIHDLVPCNLEYCKPCWSGDGYKLLAYLLLETDYDVYVTNEGNGLTFIKFNSNTKDIILSNKYKTLSFDDFSEIIKTQKRYTIKEIEEICKR